MDPNKTLRVLRQYVEANLAFAEGVQEHPDGMTENEESLSGCVVEIATTFQALDEWLCHGGFLPAAWAVTASTLCQANIDGWTCSRPVHLPTWPHVALTSYGEVRRRWTDDQPDHPEPQLLGPPDPAHADGSLIDQLDDELHRAGEIVRRMRDHERGH